MLTVVPGAADADGPRRPDGVRLIDEIVREGARRMLAEALQAEVDAYVAQFRDERDENGRRLVVRNGSHQPREVLTSAGSRPASSSNDPRVILVRPGRRQRSWAASMRARPAWRSAASARRISASAFFAPGCADLGSAPRTLAILWDRLGGGLHHRANGRRQGRRRQGNRALESAVNDVAGGSVGHGLIVPGSVAQVGA